MLINISLAVVLVIITVYTDIKEMKIYNKHTYFFGVLAILSAVFQQHYELLISGLLVFCVFCLVFYSRSLINWLVKLSGGVSHTTEPPLGGGDVKLLTVLSILLGHMPVLLGTGVAAVMALMFIVTKTWIKTRSFKTVLRVVTGKAPSKPIPFGVFLGPCILVLTIIFKGG